MSCKSFNYSSGHLAWQWYSAVCVWLVDIPACHKAQRGRSGRQNRVDSSFTCSLNKVVKNWMEQQQEEWSSNSLFDTSGLSHLFLYQTFPRRRSGNKVPVRQHQGAAEPWGWETHAWHVHLHQNRIKLWERVRRRGGTDGRMKEIQWHKEDVHEEQNCHTRFGVLKKKEGTFQTERGGVWERFSCVSWRFVSTQLFHAWQEEDKRSGGGGDCSRWDSQVAQKSLFFAMMRNRMMKVVDVYAWTSQPNHRCSSTFLHSFCSQWSESN